MRVNVDKVLERDQKLSELDDRAGDQVPGLDQVSRRPYANRLAQSHDHGSHGHADPCRSRQPDQGTDKKCNSDQNEYRGSGDAPEQQLKFNLLTILEQDDHKQQSHSDGRDDSGA